MPRRIKHIIIFHIWYCQGDSHVFANNCGYLIILFLTNIPLKLCEAETQEQRVKSLVNWIQFDTYDDLPHYTIGSWNDNLFGASNHESSYNGVNLCSYQVESLIDLFDIWISERFLTALTDVMHCHSGLHIEDIYWCEYNTDKMIGSHTSIIQLSCNAKYILEVISLKQSENIFI